ncbi:cytochrome C biogenesis protein [Candidatus Tenderia electrophaga]|jgi:cytochrome c-type biogenesis protein CcmF|uniref:Cytochrome C biogenesis protein n=1 Tax=Candidatus Tenderia electrophaga TaxID=1748243 RepID=A0A0S2THQ2_9GAMM|nr:cytochrome C biogenesis protein [Candidatus Tenderia electrophaga]
MIPEIGHFALILALCLALVQGIIPIAGAQLNLRSWMAVARPVAQGQFMFLVIAFGCLVYAFVNDDFSVLYTASHSNSLLPVQYKVAGVWGGHEGSLLLWGMMLGLWTALVSVFSKKLPDEMVARVIGVMGLISVGFILFMLLTSNPFDRLLPAAPDGRDLNPLLQDPGLVIHPPMLYMGYVGFSVAFAFAIAALLGGRLDAAWARWSRPWTIVAWAFLTVGIALGSWWAYYELGWGGWWFWDPVENASFMPWLMGTALIHSLAVTEKRGGFRSWTVLLAIFAFSLSLLGTFLVRSGVLTSVHAFATDPERGVFILGFLVVVVGVSLLLYAWRAPKIGLGGKFDLASKETMLLSNNVLLAVAAAMVLLGTCYPLFVDALGLGKVSVGAPYFNAMFVPLMVPLVFLMGLGPIARWKKASLPDMMVRLKWAAAVSIATAILVPFAMGEWVSLAALGMLMAGWIIATAAYHTYSRFKSTKPDQPWGLRLKAIPAGFFGMHLAHIGVAVAIIGVTLVTNYETEKDVRMDIGDTVDVGGYTFRFDGVIATKGANYTANQGMIRVLRDGHEVETLRPEKRIYTVQTMPMTEAAIDTSVWRDIYVSLGEPVSGGAWSVRVYHKPFVVWIWGGAVLMALGGILAICDKRYRVMARRDSKIKAESPLAAAGKLATEKS